MVIKTFAYFYALASSPYLNLFSQQFDFNLSALKHPNVFFFVCFDLHI